MSQLVIRQPVAIPAPPPAIVRRAAFTALAALALVAASPVAPQTPDAAPDAARPRRNVDPVSGKLLDRIDGAAAQAASDAPAPMLLRDAYFAFAGAEDAPLLATPTPRKSAAARTARAGAPKADSAGRKSSAAAKPAAPALVAVERAEPQPQESESWWSRWSPGAVTARAPAIGRDLASSVARGAGSVSGALINRLPALSL